MIKIGAIVATTGPAALLLVQGFESEEDVLTHVRRMREYRGMAGKITKQAGSGNFRSAPAVWAIKNGRPAMVE